MQFDLPSIREQFPSLIRPAIFLDNPGGTQIARKSLDRITGYLTFHNANHGGAFPTSYDSDAVLDEAHAAMADFLNASRKEEIIFGNNMTTLTLHMSRSIARQWDKGDRIVVTRLDHDANISPWILVAQERGVEVLHVDFNPDDGTLNMAEMEKALSEKPRFVAVGYASNALGTINPVKKICDMAHSVGAQVYIDAVQYAAHGPIDVQDLGCDFLVCSSYKFFGPHAGILYGRYELLEELFAYKLRVVPDELPGKFMTGTQNHEGIAGVLGAVEYFDWLGRTYGDDQSEKFSRRFQNRRLQLKKALGAVRAYEYEISRSLLDILTEMPGVTLYGLKDAQKLDHRVPTFSFRLKGWHPRQLAEELSRQGIYVWDGNYYAISVTERLGIEDSGGMVRVGPVHYNTLAEIEKFGEALGRIVANEMR